MDKLAATWYETRRVSGQSADPVELGRVAQW